MKLAVFSLWAGVMLALAGCASPPPTGDSRHLPAACLDDCHRLKVAPTKYVLTVNIAAQSVSLYEHNRLVKKMPASTSRFGIGQIEGSMRTPLGLHRIAEKIGEGEPPGTIFKDREVIGHVTGTDYARGTITTRILWLEGLDPGYNQGGGVDTHERTIYIHGTGDQASLGRPASHGCIHLSDVNLIAMFDLLPSGTLVWIAQK